MLGPSGNLLLSWIRDGFCFDSTLGQNQGILFPGLALKTNKNKTFCKSQPACLPGRVQVTAAEMFRGDGVRSLLHVSVGAEEGQSLDVSLSPAGPAGRGQRSDY